MRCKFWWIYIMALPICFFRLPSKAQQLSSGYEVRYFSKDAKANGETDFKGETSTLNTDQRLAFLKYYGDQVSAFYGDKDLNTEVVTNLEAVNFFKGIKPQPLPVTRKRVTLDEWKWLSARTGQHETSLQKISKYNGAKNISIKEGALSFRNASEWKWDFPVQTWRYSLSWKVRLSENNSYADFFLLDNRTGKIFAKIKTDGNSCSFYSKGVQVGSVGCNSLKWFDIRVEADMAGTDGSQYYNLFVNDKLVGDYIASNEATEQVNAFEVKASNGLEIDVLYGVGYQPTTDASFPYYPKTFIDENFDVEPAVEGWQNGTYNDNQWKTTTLPICPGIGKARRGRPLFQKNN